jgi:hypothetical protein
MEYSPSGYGNRRSATQEIPQPFMGSESSLSCYESLPHSPYPEPNESNPQPPTIFVPDPFKYYPPICA